MICDILDETATRISASKAPPVRFPEEGEPAALYLVLLVAYRPKASVIPCEIADRLEVLGWLRCVTPRNGNSRHVIAWPDYRKLDESFPSARIEGLPAVLVKFGEMVLSGHLPL